MSKQTLLPATTLLVALATTACSGAGSAGGADGSGSPTGSPAGPAASPTQGGIPHPTSADEIILRYDEAGGFVPLEFALSHVPYFTLYGDGTVVYVSSEPVTWQPNQPAVGQPIRTASLSEEQIQALLEFALGEGGLAIARERYDNPMIADAATAVFEINAADDTKTVSVMALGDGGEPGPDTAVKASLMALAQRLRNLDAGGTLGGRPYEADSYRGILVESPGVQGVVVSEWPWPDLAPADFTLPGDPNVLQQRTRVLTPEEAAATGVKGFENGIQGGVWYRGADDVLYSFVLRPLLPGEDA